MVQHIRIRGTKPGSGVLDQDKENKTSIRESKLAQGAPRWELIYSRVLILPSRALYINIIRNGEQISSFNFNRTHTVYWREQCQGLAEFYCQEVRRFVLQPDTAELGPLLPPFFIKILMCVFKQPSQTYRYVLSGDPLEYKDVYIFLQ